MVCLFVVCFFNLKKTYNPKSRFLSAQVCSCAIVVRQMFEVVSVYAGQQMNLET